MKRISYMFALAVTCSAAYGGTWTIATASASCCGESCQCCDHCQCCNATKSANKTSPGGSIEPTAAASLGTSPEARGESIPEVRELVVIGATWCQACRSVPHDVPGTRYLDLDKDREEIVRLYGATPPQIPAYTLVVNGEGIKHWFGATGTAGIKAMRDWEPTEPAGGHLVDDPLSDSLAAYHGPSAPTTRQRLKAEHGYTRGDLRYLSQGELERLQGAINSGVIDPPR